MPLMGLFMDFLSNIVPFVSSVADFLVSQPIGLAFLGLGLVGAVLAMVRRLL